MPMPAHQETTATVDHLSRRMWRALEPYHALVYFIPETRQRTDALGLKGGWMSYFGTRTAPLGPVPAEVVTALFYHFHPSMVRRAIPDAWSYASPDALTEARVAAAGEGLRRLLGAAVESDAIAALPWPDEPHLRLWHAATILREVRGDGHVAALMVGGLSPCEALVTASAAGGPPAEMLQANRRWSQDEWAETVERLCSRGWLDERGALTEAGRAGRAEVEWRTDELMKPTWDALGAERCSRLESLLLPIRAQILGAGGFPVPNPLGLI